MASTGNQRTSLEMLIELRMDDPEFRTRSRRGRSRRVALWPNLMS